MATNPVADQARELPREPTTPWILALTAAAAALWLGVMVWMLVALPERVPVQFDFGGSPTSWYSKAGALGFAVMMAAVLTLPAALVPPLALRSPGAINAPNSQWWTAAPARLRRFERLLREDLLLLAASGLLLMAVGQVGMTLAAGSPGGEMPAGIWIAMLVPLAGVILVIARMVGAGGRYAEQSDLA